MNQLLWFLAVLNVSCAYSVSRSIGNETSPILPECNPQRVECLHFSPEQRKCMLPRLAECDISAFCPEVDDVMKPVYLADKNDCTKYFVCFTGNAIERSCASGLFFDIKSNWCTFPENVTCDPRTPNAPITKPPVPIDTSICFWHDNIFRDNGDYMKTLCYFAYELTHEQASMNCQTHGMSLMRVENSLVQSATLNHLTGRFGNGNNGLYYVSGSFTNGSWYHDDNTPIYENMLWRAEGRPQSGCVIINNIGSMTFDAIDCGMQSHSICEFSTTSIV
ncbi:unnamed protein product [Diamesa serratosioi]